MGEVLVSVKNLVKEYPREGGVSRVVDDVSFEIARGETLGLVGESGSGKSTVARMILRLIEPTAGAVRFDGVDVLGASSAEMRALRQRMQIVFQDPFAALNPRMRVREIVGEPFEIHREQGLGNREQRKAGSREQGIWSGRDRDLRVGELLREVGLDASAMERFPHEFSGGQRQRVNIARALALRPEFLVLDEPVSALDVSVGAQVINLLQELQRSRGMTYLFISHSMPLVRYLSMRIAVLRQGRLVEIGDCAQVCEAPREEYTRQLIAATPVIQA
ncbi:MAG TPA: ATP-binding cassette domain-containing protein [Acidobacteriaceae bacterium]